jgi:hypothetical protein
MKNYKFHINPASLSDEDIARHMDFDSLLQKYHARKTTKRLTVKRLLPYAAAIAAVFLGAIFFFKPAFLTFEVRQENFFAERPLLNPPFEQLVPEFKDKVFKAEKGISFKTKRGNIVSVPANSMQTLAGEPVFGEVTLRYRELIDHVDFFLAGLPMNFESEGQPYNFESSGVVEIHAEQNGVSLQIDPEQPIAVELKSGISVEGSKNLAGFQVYKLGMEERNWAFEKPAELELVGFDSKAEEPGTSNTLSLQLSSLELQEAEAIRKLEQRFPMPVAPAPPRKPRNDGFVFEFKFEEDDFLSNPNIPAEEGKKFFQLYKGALWQLKPGENATSADLKKVWADAKIRPIDGQDFEITLSSPNTELKIMVNPVLAGDNLAKARAKYDSEKVTYDKLVAQRAAEIEPLLADLKAAFRAQKSDLIAKTGTNDATAIAQTGLSIAVKTKFLVSSFGLWNCLRLVQPKGLLVEGEFFDKSLNSINNTSAYLLDKESNTMIQFLATEGSEFHLSPGANQLLWVVTEDKKIAVFKPEDFRRIEPDLSTDAEIAFVMDVIDKKIDSEAIVRKILTL